MKVPSNQQYFLIIRPHDPVPAINAVDAYAKLDGVGWLLSALKTGDDEALRNVLSHRTRDHGDIPIASGYSDAPHYLLLEREFESEIKWAFSNPWRTGVLDLVPDAPRWLLPFSHDEHRSRAAAIYAENAQVLLTFELPAARTLDPLRLVPGLRLPRSVRPSAASPAGDRPAYSGVLRAFDGNRNVLLPYLSPNLHTAVKDGTSLTRLFARFSRVMRGPFVILLDATYSPRDSLAAALDALSAAVGPAGAWPTGIDQLLQIAPEAEEGHHPSRPADELPWRPFLAYDPARCRAAAALRSLKGSAERRIRSVLETCSTPPDTDDLPAPPESEKPFPPDAQIIASMHGTATLYGGQFDVQFVEGRVDAVEARGFSIPFAQSMVSAVGLDGVEIPYRSEGAFSFETSISGREVRGLVSNFSAEGPGIDVAGKIAVHASFIEGFAPLILDMYVDYPRFVQGSRSALLYPAVLPLFAGEKGKLDVEAVSWYPDGSSAEARFAASPTETAMYGRMFRFRNAIGPSLYVTFADERIQTVRPVLCGVTLEKQTALFSARLACTPQEVRAETVSNRREHLTLLLLPDDDTLGPEGAVAAFKLPQFLRSRLQPPWFD